MNSSGVDLFIVDNSENCEVGTELLVDIVAARQSVKVIAASPYNPAGKEIRG